MLSTFSLLLLLATEPVPPVTLETIAQLAACQKAAEAAVPTPTGLLTNDVRAKRTLLVRQALTDELARKHSFSSAAQVFRFELRVMVAAFDFAEEASSATPLPSLESLEKTWRADPDMTEETLASRRETYRSAVASHRQARERFERRKTTKQATLASSGHFEEAEQAPVKKEAATQPPLSDSERKAWAAWMKRK